MTRGRRPREDRSELLSRVIAVRLTENEGKALDALVAHHNAKLRKMGLTAAITAASFARSCVIQAAVRAGLLPPLVGDESPSEEAPLVVVPPLRRGDPKGPPLPPATRFDRALAPDTFDDDRKAPKTSKAKTKAASTKTTKPSAKRKRGTTPARVGARTKPASKRSSARR